MRNAALNTRMALHYSLERVFDPKADVGEPYDRTIAAPALHDAPHHLKTN